MLKLRTVAWVFALSASAASGAIATPGLSDDRAGSGCENDVCQLMIYCEHVSDSKTGCDQQNVSADGGQVPCATYQCE